MKKQRFDNVKINTNAEDDAVGIEAYGCNLTINVILDVTSTSTDESVKGIFAGQGSFSITGGEVSVNTNANAEEIFASANGIQAGGGVNILVSAKVTANANSETGSAYGIQSYDDMTIADTVACVKASGIGVTNSVAINGASE